MEQERGVDAVEEPVIDHHLLARAAFLGRGPEEDDLAGESSATAASPIAARPLMPPSCCGRSHARGPATRRTRRGSRSEGPPGHGRPRTTSREPPSRAGRRMFDAIAVRRDGVGDPCGRLSLLEGGSRIGVDPVAQFEDLVTGGQDRLDRRSLHVRERFAGAAQVQPGRTPTATVSAPPRGSPRR